MRVRTRNRIIVSCHALIGAGLLATLFRLLWLVSPKKAVLHVAVAVMTAAIGWIGAEFYIRRTRQMIERIRREADLLEQDFHQPKEDPLPIIPPLMNSKEELIAGLIAIALIILVLILSWTGTFEKWFGG